MYIKINLLPRGLRPRKALISLDYRVVVALVFIIVAAGLVGYYLYIVRNLRDEEAELNNWKQAELMLKNTVDLQNEVNTLRGDVAKRINIIKELTSDSDLRFSILYSVPHCQDKINGFLRCIISCVSPCTSSCESTGLVIGTKL